MLQFLRPNLYLQPGEVRSNNIAAFDLGWTLTRPVYGIHHQDENDWSFLPNRLSTLKYYRDQGYTLAIFTNQGHKYNSLKFILRMVDNIIHTLHINGLYPWVFVSTKGKSVYHKPHTGMWELFTKIHSPDVKSSFFVGDSAGRPQDANDNDKMFAYNIGLKFYTPEEIFPVNLIKTPKHDNYLFILIGMPGSGKADFYRKYLSDSLLTDNPVVAAYLLSLDKSVTVIPKTATIRERSMYIRLGTQYDVYTTILYFVRNGYKWNRLKLKPCSDIVYTHYFRNLDEPYFDVEGVPVIEIDRV